MLLSFFMTFIVDTAWLWAPLLLIYMFTRGKHNDAGTNFVSVQDAERDQLWRSYLASFQGVVKTPKEKKLIEALLEGKTAAQYSGGSLAPTTITDQQPAETSEPSETGDPATQSVMAAETYQPLTLSKPAKPIDNTILLLYFGAFLLVASVGLFVAIGGLDGMIRTIIVAITAAVLYFGGLWLQAASTKLAQAGISFVGSGLIVAPLTGVAWYNLVSGQTYAGPIWLLTSIACIGMYVHAYSRIKNDFIAYLLIGSFVSSIESAVLTIHLPAYGYAWGLIVTALLLTLNNRLRGQSIELNRASSTSSQLLIPLSVLGSIMLLPEFGSIQLSITLFLSGAYYALLAIWQTKDRPSLAAAAQIAFIASASTLVYAVQRLPEAAGIALIVIAALYGGILIYSKPAIIRIYNLATIGASTSAIGILLCLGEAWPLVIGIGVAVLLAAIVWLKLKSQEALLTAGLLLIVLPFVAGQYALQEEWGSLVQLVLCAASAGLLGSLIAAVSSRATLRPYYNLTAGLYILATAALLVPAGALSFETLSGVSLAVMASYIVLHAISKDSKWLLSSAIVAFVPVTFALLVLGVSDTRFSAAVAAALIWNIGVSLVTREALVRWLVVTLLLIAPFAIGGGGLGIQWAAAGYAGGYILAMISCIAARAIARGKLLVSSTVPIASYYREASQAYVVGYTLAGSIAILISLTDDHSRIVTTVVLGVITLAIITISRIERNAELLALLPIVMQGVLFSALRPDIDNIGAIGLTAVVSTLAATSAYAFVTLLDSPDPKMAKSTRLTSVITAYLGPALALTQSDPSLLLPASLCMAGLLTYDYNKLGVQVSKELSLAVSIVSIHWLLYLLGYTNIHIHSHLLAVFLAGFAYWRNLSGDSSGCLMYIQALFFIVTVPLIIQSLSGESGSSYGLLLIGEQAFFMLAGVSFGQRFLLRWGLWTALAAILFQLKGLGWAFTSMLALIIIGVAVYRLQKHPPDDS